MGYCTDSFPWCSHGLLHARKSLQGYGVHLIKNLMDKVIYNAKGNRVVAIKYLR